MNFCIHEKRRLKRAIEALVGKTAAMSLALKEGYPKLRMSSKSLLRRSPHIRNTINEILVAMGYECTDCRINRYLRCNHDLTIKPDGEYFWEAKCSICGLWLHGVKSELKVAMESVTPAEWKLFIIEQLEIKQGLLHGRTNARAIHDIKELRRRCGDKSLQK